MLVPRYTESVCNPARPYKGDKRSWNLDGIYRLRFENCRNRPSRYLEKWVH
jgi:hypothetical protein